MNIVYGDTDSIFVSRIRTEQVHNNSTAFIRCCKENMEVDVDHQNTFVKSILLAKKHYIGIQPDGKVVIKGMEGKKKR